MGKFGQAILSKIEHSNDLIYLATKFPLLSETFIYEEIIALKELGYKVRFFVLYPTGKESHQFTKGMEENIYYLPHNLSITSILGHLNFLLSNPNLYFSTLVTIFKDTILNPLIMLKSLYSFGKGVSLARALRDSLPGHIHSHWATMPTTVAFVASKLIGVTYSFTSHAWDIYKEPAMLATKIQCSAFHVTISQYNQEYVKKLYPPTSDKNYVVHCGVDIDRFTFRKEYPNLKSPEILFIGRLVEKKGTTNLVEACAKLKKQGYEFVCNIIGDGPQKDQVREAIERHQLQGSVNLVGELPREKLHSYWEKAGMFVLPCTIEKDGNRDGIPIVLMEAMASGIPVVSTNISGIPELIEDKYSGLLLPPDDVEQLSKAMMKIIDNSELAQQLTVNARLKIEQEFNVKINTQKKAKLFDKYLFYDGRNDG